MRAKGVFFLPLFVRFLLKNTQKRCTFKSLLKSLCTKNGTAKKRYYHCGNNGNDGKQQVEACIALTVAALARKYVNQKEDPADYGDYVQNATPEVVPRREGSVSLGQKHIGCFGIDSLFHVFSPFLRSMPKYYTYSIPLFSFFGKGFFNIFSFFSKKPCNLSKKAKITGCIPYKVHRQGSSKSAFPLRV